MWEHRHTWHSRVAIFVSFHQRKQFFPCVSAIPSWHYKQEEKPWHTKDAISGQRSTDALQPHPNCPRDLGGSGVASAGQIPACAGPGRAARSGSFLKKTIQLRVPHRPLLSSPRGDRLKSLWWQNQFVTGLSFTVLSHACWQARQKLWQEWQRRRLRERSKGKQQEAATGGSHLLLSCCNGLAGRTKLAASHFLAHSSVYAHEG